MNIISTRDMIRCCLFDRAGQCIRLDVIIRLIGAECWREGGRVHFVYDKLMYERCFSLPAVPTLPTNHPQRFTDLLQSMKGKGYLKEFPVELDQNGKLYEGAHRIAAVLMFGIKELSFSITSEPASFVGIENHQPTWYTDRFCSYEMQIINSKIKRANNDCLESISISY